MLKHKPEDADFTSVADIFRVPNTDLKREWRFLRRLSGDLSSAVNLIELATNAEKSTMFPNFSRVATKILPVPMGTAGIERSFSTMNRILNSERCRLSPEYVNVLMQLSFEGPVIPGVCEGT